MSEQSRRYVCMPPGQTRSTGDVCGAGAEVVGEAAHGRLDRHFREGCRVLHFVKAIALPMLMLRRVSQRRQHICRHGLQLRSQHTLARGERPTKKWDAESPDDDARVAEWEAHGRSIRSGAQQSMLSVLEERGFVKDVAG